MTVPNHVTSKIRYKYYLLQEKETPNSNVYILYVETKETVCLAFII